VEHVIIAIFPTRPIRCRDCWDRFWIFDRAWPSVARSLVTIMTLMLIVIAAAARI